MADRERLETDSVERWLREIHVSVCERSDYLTQLDAAIGDGDHGVNMKRGFDAVVATLDDPERDIAGIPPGSLLQLAGKTLVSSVGGASGPLWGSAFRGAGQQLNKLVSFDGHDLAKALDAGLLAIKQLGTADIGDKTMVDSLDPAIAGLRTALARDATLKAALGVAAQAADDGARATVPMQARKGRASYLGERSIGHQDPGATSVALIMRALERAAP